MSRISSKRFLTALVAFALLALSTPRASAQSSGSPLMVWRHNITDRVEKQRIKNYGVGPYADATTRLETELQAGLDLKRLPQAIKQMDKLANSGSAAAKVFGKGYRVVKLNKPPRKVWDRYFDTSDGLLANTSASLRIRTENGIAQINFKPTGSHRFANGMAHRVEAGINVNVGKSAALSDKVYTFLANTRLKDNPLREVPTMYQGRNVKDFFNPVLDIKQKRQMYEVQRLEHGQWVKVSEISLDHVTARSAANPRMKTQFGRVELEGEHVSLQLTQRQQQALASAATPRPHSYTDARNEAFTKSKDVKEIHRLSGALSGYLNVTPAGESKYSQARKELQSRGASFAKARASRTPKAPRARTRFRSATPRSRTPKATSSYRSRTPLLSNRASTRAPRLRTRAR